MKTFLAVLFLLFLVFLPRDGRAQWIADGLGVCVQPSEQAGAVMAPDGLGGAIIVWSDNRNGNADIYAQRVSGSGVPQWAANGVPICTAANAQGSPAIVADGAGGATMAWQDHRGASDDIYAQRIDANGVAQWAIDGVALCTAANTQRVPAMSSDGTNGAIVTWTDHRSGTNDDVYVQRVDALGVVQWSPDGVGLCTAAKDQWSNAIVSDGAGGAIVVWEHAAALGNYDVYARAINASGVPQWTTNGVAICTSPDEQTSPVAASDGTGGAIITWYDNRNLSGYNIYAQRINASGAPVWTVNGVALCTDPNDQFSPVICPDEAGGAIITWMDYRSPATPEHGSQTDIYAQRVSDSGVAQWTTNGVALCTADGDQAYPSIAPDGVGGAVVAWHDWRGGATTDVYAQHLTSSGAISWPTDGVAVSTALNNQAATRVVSDGAGGAVIAWADQRSGDYDVYAQRIGTDGAIPTGVRDTPPVSGVFLSPNYPNPFSSGTAIDLDLRHGDATEIDVFDAAGRRVRQIDVGRPRPGLTHLTFDGLDDGGRPLASGVYFYRVKAAGQTFTRKMVIAR